MNKQELAVRAGVIIGIGIYLIATYPGFAPFPEITTIVSAWVLYSFMGVIPAYNNNIIFINLQNQTRIMNVSAECSGILIVAVFVLVIFITPGIKLKHCFLSLLFIPLLLGVNVVRIVSGIWIGGATTIDILLLYHGSIGQVMVFAAMIISYITFLKLFGYFQSNHIKIKSNIN